jgi:hypothetical protein
LTEATDAGARDASVDAGKDASRIDPPAPYEPACLLDPPTYVPPTPLPSLPVTPKVLWTKPLGFRDPTYVPILVTADAVVISAGPYLYFFSHDGDLKFKKSWPGSNIVLNTVADAAGNIYAATQTLVRIAPDGTELEYPVALKKNITAGFEYPFLAGLALDPTGTIHVAGTDGYLHGVRMTATEATSVYDVQFAGTRELVSRPVVFGVGGTVVVNETLFDPKSGKRIGPDRAYEDRGASIVAGNGFRMVRPRSTIPSSFDYLDTCGKKVAQIPSFGEYSLPWLTTFDGGMMWEEGIQPKTAGTFNVTVDLTGPDAQPAGHWEGVPGMAMLTGADGTVVRFGQEGGVRMLYGTSERLESRWKIPFPGVPSRSGTLLPNGVLYVVDDVNFTLSAIQSPSPGLAALSQSQVATTANFPPRNWVGDK